MSEVANFIATAQLTLLSKVGRGQNAGHWKTLGHLLEHLNEEPDLNLSSLLEQRIQSGSSLGLTQDAKPLFDGAQLVLEVLVEGGCGHLFQRGLILIDVGKPLLGGALHLVWVARLCAAAPEVYLRGRANAAVGERRGEAAHVGGSPQVVAGADRARVGRAQRAGAFRGAVPVGGDVGHDVGWGALSLACVA